MAGNDDKDTAATNGEDAEASERERARHTANARYLYVKHRLPGESYEAFLNRLSDELATEPTRREDAGEPE